MAYSDGWEIASAAQVVDLWWEFGINIDLNLGIGGPPGPALFDAADILGCTVCDDHASFLIGTWGMVSNPPPDDPWSSLRMLMGAYYWQGLSMYDGIDNLYHDITEGMPLAGTYLVRESSHVPVPAAIWLFGSGLIGLIGLARRM
jgi:hypothetical protein